MTQFTHGKKPAVGDPDAPVLHIWDVPMSSLPCLCGILQTTVSVRHAGRSPCGWHVTGTQRRLGRKGQVWPLPALTLPCLSPHSRSDHVSNCPLWGRFTPSPPVPTSRACRMELAFWPMTQNPKSALHCLHRDSGKSTQNTLLRGRRVLWY